MKEVYRQAASRYGITWNGRRYDRNNPEGADIPNQTLNHAATAAEAAASVAIAAVGALPQLGFVHEDSGSAFILDIADLVRHSFTVPVAFAAARGVLERGEDLEVVTRRLAGKEIREQKLVPTLIARVQELFDADDGGGDPGCG